VEVKLPNLGAFLIEYGRIIMSYDYEKGILSESNKRRLSWWIRNEI